MAPRTGAFADRRQPQPWRSWLPPALAVASLILLAWWLGHLQATRGCSSSAGSGSGGGMRLLPAGLQRPRARARTLAVYVFGGSDPEYADNLRSFVGEAVKEGDGCDYVIVLQQGEGQAEPDPLPALPPNARYLRHPNECFDIGTVGWVLESQLGPQGRARYAYFVWLNSSVRGPFLPAYLRGRLHWTEPLLSKLGGERRVGLVGPTINCGRAYDLPPTPHVQSYVSATDAAGLAVLLRSERVFRCWGHIHETIIHSEIGASAAMLAAGRGIDCLMLRYQGVDWRDPAVTQRACNGGLSPLQPGFNDGLSVEPMEVMFVKVKAAMRAAGNWPHVAAAVKYASWLEVQAAEAASQAASAHAPPSQAWLDALSANEWPVLVAPALLEEAERRGPGCFDHAFYIDSGYDLAFMRDDPDPAGLAWEQFLRMGLYEGRPYRFVC